MELLLLSSSHWSAMRAHVASCAPLEACGLLAGKENSVISVLPISNLAGSRTRFRMNPAEQLRAFAWMESNHMNFVGIYHSHPSGPEKPSATDINEAAYSVAYVIWFPSMGDWHARGFRITNSRTSNVELRITEGLQPPQ